MVGKDDPRDGEIDDPEDISQKQRIKEILDRRRRTLEARDEAKMETLLGGTNEARALLYYRAHLESLIYELWNVFRNFEAGESESEDSDTPTGKYYLEEKHLGTVTVSPPESLIGAIGQLDAGENLPESKRFEIEGLKWYLEHPDTIQATFAAESFDPPERVVESNERVLRWDELDAGLRACFEFIHKAGIDADLAEEEQQTKIDRELLEEVEEWRQANVEQ